MFFDKRAGWMRTWEPLKDDNGNLGCGVVVGPGVEWKTTATDNVLVGKAIPGVPFVTHVGAAWDCSGDVADAAAWTEAGRGDGARGRRAGSHHAVAVAPRRRAPRPRARRDAWARRAADAVMAGTPARSPIAGTTTPGWCSTASEAWAARRATAATSTTSRRPSTA